MVKILYVLLGCSYLVSLLTLIYFKKKYAIVNFSIILVLSISVLNSITSLQVFISLIWLIWVLDFNIVAFINYYISKGTINIYQNGNLFWGVYFLFNVFLCLIYYLDYIQILVL